MYQINIAQLLRTNKGNNKFTVLWAILQMESQNS